jgi:hypothetical protein
MQGNNSVTFISMIGIRVWMHFFAGNRIKTNLCLRSLECVISENSFHIYIHLGIGGLHMLFFGEFTLRFQVLTADSMKM